MTIKANLGFLAMLTIVVVAPNARATTIQRTVGAGSCRLGAFATCAASGECTWPAALSGISGGGYNVYQADGEKLQTKSDQTHTGYPLTFACPVTRVFKSAGSGSSPPPLNVQISAQTPGSNRAMSCVVYSLTKYGVVTQSVNLSSTTANPTQFVKGGQITSSSADGGYNMWCTLDNQYPGSGGAALYGWRTEEISSNTDQKWRTYSGTRCQATGANVSTKLRYFSNKAQNVDTVNRDVTCPAHEIQAVTGMSPPYTATVYLNEAKSGGGSKCRLVSYWQSRNEQKQATPYITTTGTGDKTLALAILPSIFTDYAFRYSVECTLTPNSSVYQYVMGH